MAGWMDGERDGRMDKWMNSSSFLFLCLLVSGPRSSQEALNISISASSLISFLTNPSWAQGPSLPAHTSPCSALMVMTCCEGFQICLKLATLVTAHCNPGWNQPFSYLCLFPETIMARLVACPEVHSCQALSQMLYTYLPSRRQTEARPLLSVWS